MSYFILINHYKDPSLEHTKRSFKLVVSLIYMKLFWAYVFLCLLVGDFLLKLHEAIMQEESSEFEEGIIIQEFRKGFKLGERLLRPSMVKVSAGPGPEKVGDDIVLPHEDGEASENIEDDVDS